MHVAAADLIGAQRLVDYRAHRPFQLADGRIYLDGLIAVASLELARVIVDQMVEHQQL